MTPERTVRAVHNIPGRLRLRLPPLRESVQPSAAVEGLAGVRRWAWSPRTRGLLVVYDPGSISADAIIEAVRNHVGLPVASLSAPLPGPPAGAALAAAVTGVASELDGRVRYLSGGLLGLGGLFPLALALWAVRELAIGRAAPLVWSSALWYAHGLFRDYNTPSS